MKKLIAILITMAMVVCFASTVAFAAEKTYSEGDLYYTVDDESITITGYFGDDATVEIPASIAGIPVNAVAAGAFADTPAETIYLPETIRYLGDGALGEATVVFADGTSAEELIASSTVTSNGQGNASGGADSSQGATGSQSVVAEKEDSSQASGSQQTVVGSDGSVAASDNPFSEGDVIDDDGEEGSAEAVAADNEADDTAAESAASESVAPETIDTSVVERDGITIARDDASESRSAFLPLIIVLDAILLLACVWMVVIYKKRNQKGKSDRKRDDERSSYAS